jgi:hypothetical protein
MALYASCVERGLSALVNHQGHAMSRFHPVRPKKDKHKRSNAPQSAVPTQPPAMPSYEQAQKVMLDQLEKARAELYKMRNGDVLDASIARWKRNLAIHDREAEAVQNSDMSKPHRWTVSPAMALRAEKHLETLLQRQSELMDECHKDAHQIVTEIYAEKEREAQRAVREGSSLCPPKQTPVPGTGSEAAEYTTSNTSIDEPPLKPVA